jgi:hypothetical protein
MRRTDESFPGKENAFDTSLCIFHGARFGVRRQPCPGMIPNVLYVLHTGTASHDFDVYDIGVLLPVDFHRMQ